MVCIDQALTAPFLSSLFSSDKHLFLNDIRRFTPTGISVASFLVPADKRNNKPRNGYLLLIPDTATADFLADCLTASLAVWLAILATQIRVARFRVDHKLASLNCLWSLKWPCFCCWFEAVLSCRFLFGLRFWSTRRLLGSLDFLACIGASCFGNLLGFRFWSCVAASVACC